MIYSEFYSLIHWVIQSRWSTYLYNNLTISNMTNICIQQIYNEYRWSFLYSDLKMDSLVQEWEYYTYDISSIKIKTNIEVKDTKDDYVLYKVNSFIDLDDSTFLIRDKKIYFTKDTPKYMHYLKWYSFKEYNKDWWIELDIPDNLTTALYYLVLSQIDLLYVLQAEQEPRANFNKYQYEIENCKKDDIDMVWQLTWTKL